ncbi:MAG: hypothetical protein ACOCUY_01650 [Verrucomicrobiota bacterium]
MRAKTKLHRGTPAAVGVCVIFAVCGLTQVGCLSLGGGNKPLSARTDHIITVHALAGRAERDTQLQRQMRLANGRTLSIRSVNLLSSASIREIEKYTDQNGQLSAIAHVNRHGELSWTQACAAFPGERVVVAVDGQFHHFLSLPRLSSVDDTINLGGPWEPEELDKLIRWAPKNYREMTAY